ncbi:MAG: SpoIIIAH-like family protein [Oscillospiraceae bacterium]|nr:SpoIIIAH-like family protein [Oscillospiraceae bacterium]
MKTWKKNVVAAAVLVTVCAGIYVNWLYTEDQATANLTDTLDESKILSSDMLVMNDGSTLPVDTNNTIIDYFAAVRLSRQEARDSAVGLLQEAMAYGDSDKNAQTNAQLEELVQSALCEAQIESLIIAKGYTDCVAYISDEGISVAVASPKDGLKQTDVAVIADIVMTQSKFTMEDIRVVEVL